VCGNDVFQIDASKEKLVSFRIVAVISLALCLVIVFFWEESRCAKNNAIETTLPMEKVA